MSALNAATFARTSAAAAALIVTVSWKTLPVYDAPDIIFLAAWSPLIIAGAPVYSIDGRLAALHAHDGFPEAGSL